MSLRRRITAVAATTIAAGLMALSPAAADQGTASGVDVTVGTGVARIIVDIPVGDDMARIAGCSASLCWEW